MAFPPTVHRIEDDKLPTASTCFNTLKLPEYSSAAELAAKLRQALGESAGFHEGAVAM